MRSDGVTEMLPKNKNQQLTRSIQWHNSVMVWLYDNCWHTLWWCNCFSYVQATTNLRCVLSYMLSHNASNEQGTTVFSFSTSTFSLPLLFQCHCHTFLYWLFSFSSPASHFLLLTWLYLPCFLSRQICVCLLKCSDFECVFTPQMCGGVCLWLSVVKGLMKWLFLGWMYLSCFSGSSL